MLGSILLLCVPSDSPLSTEQCLCLKKVGSESYKPQTYIVTTKDIKVCKVSQTLVFMSDTWSGMKCTCYEVYMSKEWPGVSYMKGLTIKETVF